MKSWYLQTITFGFTKINVQFEALYINNVYLCSRKSIFRIQKIKITNSDDEEVFDALCCSCCCRYHIYKLS